MNALNHFLTAFNLLVIFFADKASMLEIGVFALVFGLAPDLDLLLYGLWKKPGEHKRTWFQEPFSFLIICLPLAILLFFYKPNYSFMALIAWASHIILDYIVMHEVTPLAPFSKSNYNAGFILPYPKRFHPWLKKRKGISENWFTLLNLVVLIILLS